MTVTAVALGTLGTAALWWRRSAGDGSLRRVQDAGVLRVGYAVEPPYALVASDGSASGESPEVAREVARRLGLEPQWVLTDFEQLLDGLEVRRFDLVAAGLFIDPQRAQRVRFTRPTLRVRPGWLTLAGNPRKLSSYARLPRQAGLRVVVLAGSVEEAALRALAPPPGMLTPVPDAQSGLAAVSRGAADALALSLPSVLRMAASSRGRLEAVPAEGPGAQVGLVALALHRDDVALARAVDDTLAGYIGSAAHVAMLRRFGLSAADVPRADDGPR
jgi:polar amino acid transport system substrate-binding protein